MDPSDLRRILVEDVETLDLWDRAMQRGPGGDFTSEEARSSFNNVQGAKIEAPQGNSANAALRRLRKDRPDLHERVLGGEMSPHAAAVEAGFRKRTYTIPQDPDRVAEVVGVSQKTVNRAKNSTESDDSVGNEESAPTPSLSAKRAKGRDGNIHRRHLTPSQRAMVAARILDDPRYGIREAAEERKAEGHRRGAEVTNSGQASNGAQPSEKVKATQQAAALVGASGSSTERAVLCRNLSRFASLFSSLTRFSDRLACSSASES